MESIARWIPAWWCQDARKYGFKAVSKLICSFWGLPCTAQAWLWGRGTGRDPVRKQALLSLPFHPCLLLLLFSCSGTSDSLPPCGLQHARLPCPSPSPGACSDSCALRWGCHPTISSFSSASRTRGNNHPHKSTPCPQGGRATLEIRLQPPTYTSAVIFKLLHRIWKKDKGRSTWFRRILSVSAGGHCAVTLLVFCLSPQRVLGEEAPRRCFSELGSLGARPSRRAWGGALLFDSQFKGTSSPPSSPPPCGGSLKETVTVFRSLIFFFPKGFELTFYISSHAFVPDNCFPQNTVWRLCSFTKTQGGNHGTQWHSHGFSPPSYFTFFKISFEVTGYLPSSSAWLILLRNMITDNIRVLSRIKLWQQWWAGACDL